MSDVVILRIDNGRLVAKKGDRVEELDTVERVKKFLNAAHARGWSVACSSSLDFPHEYTTDQNVLELCRMIRPHGWLTNFVRDGGAE